MAGFRNDWFWLVLATVLYWALARFGMALFALQPDNITLLWLPSGVALVMCLQYGYRALPLIMLASFAANYPGMSADPARAALLHAAVSAFADGLAGILAMHAMRRFLPEGVRRSNDLLRFGLLVCLLPTSISSFILSFNLYIGGYIAAADVPAMLRMLLLADSLGIILIYQIYAGWRDERQIEPNDMRWALLAVATIIVLLWLGFGPLPGLVFFVVPTLVVLSFAVGLLVVATLSSLSLVSIIIATAKGVGLFAQGDADHANFDTVAFAFASALTIFGIALQNRQLLLSERSNRFWRVAAEHDPLTGLGNRRVFMPRLHYEHQRAVRNAKVYTVAILDLDNFKIVNDRYGHDAGDKALRLLAKVMLKNCRAIDSVARIGGEEFAILLPESSADDALVALERIRHELENTPVIVAEAQAITITVSIGIATYRSNISDADEVMVRADKALYAAKSAGRNRIVIDQ